MSDTNDDPEWEEIVCHACGDKAPRLATVKCPHCRAIYCEPCEFKTETQITAEQKADYCPMCGRMATWFVKTSNGAWSGTPVR